MCRAISEYGLTLLRDGDGILTHCNAGPLATSRYGTALAIRLVEKLGFRQEGLSPRYLNIDGVWEDHLRMALLYDEE